MRRLYPELVREDAEEMVSVSYGLPEDSRTNHVSPLVIAVVLLSSVLLAITPSPALAGNPPCGATLTANTILTGVINCGTPFGYVVGAAGITVSCNGAIITGPGSGTGIFDNGFPDVVIKGCLVKDFNYGIGVVFTSNATITGNRAFSNTYIGILLGSDVLSAVTRNIARGNEAGFWINGSSTDTILNNQAIGNGLPAVSMSQDSGFVVSASSYDTLKGNSASVNYGNGYTVAGANHTVLERNSATGNHLDGVSLGYSPLNLLYENVVTTSGEDGISLNRSDTNVVFLNFASRNGVNGLHFDNSTTNAIIQNIASRNGQDGFHFEFDAINNQIIDNRSLMNVRYRCYDATGIAGPLHNFYSLNNGTPVGPAFSVPPGLFPA